MVSLPIGATNVWKKLPDFSDLTVLVVEDDADSRDLLREILQACGAIVLEADNIQTAKECVSTLRTNLIVTDLALPGEDGASFLKWLREQPRHKGGTLPVIAVTAYSKEYPPTELSGWAAYFQKPLNIEEFITTIAAILKRPRRTGA
jgi:DNA-binding response OmpR family regulator